RHRDGIQAPLQFVRPLGGALRGTHQRSKPADVVEDPVHAAVVADPHFHAVPHQLGGDVGLDVGEADHEVRLQGKDPVDLRAGEGTDLGLFLPRPWRPHGKTADADDAVGLAQCVQHLGGLLGEADDPARPGHGYSIRLLHSPARSLSYSTRSWRRCPAPYQNSRYSGRTRIPDQRSGRGTSRPSNCCSTSAIRSSKRCRVSIVSDCLEAHAQIWLPRLRLAKYASASSSETSSTGPSTRICTPSSTRGQWNTSAAWRLSCSSRPLRPSRWV